jgi:cold-inducible RNA-binding protein
MGISIVYIVSIVVVLILLAVIIASIKRRKKSAGGAGGDSLQLYVGNLSYRVHERDLRRYFEEYGEIKHLKVVKDRETRRSKGFGFVTFANSKGANAALKAHGQAMSGRNLVVRFAKPR